jgi:hypothetical protein
LASGPAGASSGCCSWQVRSYWQLSLGVADSLLVLVVVAAGAIVMSHETLQSSYALKDIIPRLAVAAIAANASLAICGQMVNIANVLSTALLGNGVEPQQAGHTLELLVLNAITNGGIFLILLGLACAVLAVALLILYLVRALLCLFYILLRIPFWAKEMVLSGHRSNAARMKAKRYAEILPRSSLRDVNPFVILAVPSVRRAETATAAIANTRAPIAITVWSAAVSRSVLTAVTTAAETAQGFTKIFSES